MEPSRCSSAEHEIVTRFFEGRTGRGVRVAVLDSGVNVPHPHVTGVVDGVVVYPDGGLDGDYVDRLGHGTAVAAAICEKVPESQLVAVKIFRESLATNVKTLIRAIQWAVADGARVISLSLGTSNAQHAPGLAEVVEYARHARAIIIAARGEAGALWFPGSLAGVVPVLVDWDCPRDAYRVEMLSDGTAVFKASGYPRSIPGVPRERNLMGVSFAVANMTGFVARAVEGKPDCSLEDLFAMLRAAARVPSQTFAAR
jgi:subtilisin family serine protease